MSDLKDTVIPKSDQLNADDFITGPKTIRITGVKVVKGDQPVSISYEGDMGKPYKPCKSMRRVLITLWGTDGQNYVDKYMTLYNDTSVKWAGKEVGGIRISHMSDIEKDSTIILTVSRAIKKAFKILLLKMKSPVESECVVTSVFDQWKTWIDSQLGKVKNPTVEEIEKLRSFILGKIGNHEEKDLIIGYLNKTAANEK